MGYTLYANNGSRTFDGGMSGFFNLRKNIALAFDKELGEHYITLIHCWSKESIEEFDRKTAEILNSDRFSDDDIDIIEFLFQPDCDGSISHKTCKKIYDLIKNIDFGDKIFVYVAHSDGNDYEHFKDFLLECYSHRRRMRWH